MPDDLDYSQLTPQRVLVLRYQLEDRLMSPGSMSGHQAERMRQGLGGAPPDGARPNTTESERAKLADLVLLCKGLTIAEELVCRARYGSTSGSREYKRLRRSSDMREGDGEQITNPRPDGFADMVEVTGREARFPSWAEVASAVGGTQFAVKHTLNRARTKIALALFGKHRVNAHRTQRRQSEIVQKSR